MKNFTIAAFFAANILGFATLPQVEAATPSYGPVYYEKQNLTDVESYGPTSFDGTTVTGKTKIYGPMQARHAHFKGLEVNGPFKAKDSHFQEAIINGPVNVEKATFEGKVEINGPLMAQDSHFKGSLSVAARRIKLEGSHAKSIEIRASNDADDKKGQIVILKDSVIEGNIKFVKGNGKVIVLRGSKMKGQVEGGQLIEK